MSEKRRPLEHMINVAPEFRTDIATFAAMMEIVMQRNDFKGGYDKCHAMWLNAKLVEEVGELGLAVHSLFKPDGLRRALPSQAAEIARLNNAIMEAVDVAMMVASVLAQEVALRNEEVRDGDQT